MNRKQGILLGLFVASVAVGAICFDARLSRLGDNAEFIVIAKGLASGQGMSFVHGPEPEPARKFPPGYPAILAVVQLLSPGNVDLMKSVSILFFAFAVPLTWLVVREVDTEPVALVVAGAALLSPHLIEFSHQVLSEMPYAAVSLAGLLYLLRHRAPEDPKTLLVLVVLAVAAYYVRTIGLTMIGAVVCTAFLDRRYKHGFLMGVAAALLILPWVVQSSAYLDQFSSVNPYQTESSPLVTAGILIDRVAANLGRYGLRFFPLAFAPFLPFDPPHAWPAVTLAVAIDLLLLYFLVASVRRSRPVAPIGVYLVLYFTVVLLWPEVWADTRFVVPVIPLATYALFWAVRDLLSRLPLPAPYARWAPYAFSGLLLLANASRAATTQIDHAPYHPAWQNYFDSAEWIRTNTPADALIVCRKPFLMHVMSGRTTMGYPWIQPEPLVIELDRSGADYVVTDVLFGSTQSVLNPAIRRFPQSFLLVHTYPESGTSIYEFLGYEGGAPPGLEDRLAAVNATLEENPDDTAAWRQLYAMGTLFHQANDLERARGIYERVLPVLRDESNVSLNLGILHYAQGRYKDAIVAFTDAANQMPEDPEPRLGLAQAYERVGKFDNAFEQAREAARRQPQSVVAFHTMARAAVALGEHEEAERAFRRALEIEPSSTAVLNDLAYFYLRTERYEEARQILDGLIEQNPNRAEFRLNMISALTRLGRPEEAKPHLTVLLTRQAGQITQGPLKDVAAGVLAQLAERLGTTPAGLIEGIREDPAR